MAQSWSQLLFAHWPISPDVLRSLIPSQLQIDTYEGQAWIGVVPFYMSHVRGRGLPLVPGTNQFCELNVRTYVTDGQKAGVWFFSLDASNPLAVFGARTAFHLPYFNARMSIQQTGDRVTYESKRTHQGAHPADFSVTYSPTSAVYHSTPGTLLSWLTERYCLYTSHGGYIYRGEIHHAPWPLQDAQANIRTNTMAQAAGIVLPDTAPLLHYAEQIDVVTWYLGRIAHPLP
jgi:uncharacterized protein YqjF (DUF2071 family)